MIASLTGADLVLIVTEPTLSGLHDLGRVAELTSYFKIPAFVCINKADINPSISEEVEGCCQERGIRVLGRIGYDEDFTMARIQGKSLVEFSEGDAAKAE